MKEHALKIEARVR